MATAKKKVVKKAAPKKKAVKKVVKKAAPKKKVVKTVAKKKVAPQKKQQINYCCLNSLNGTIGGNCALDGYRQFFYLMEKTCKCINKSIKKLTEDWMHGR